MLQAAAVDVIFVEDAPGTVVVLFCFFQLSLSLMVFIFWLIINNIIIIIQLNWILSCGAPDFFGLFSPSRSSDGAAVEK